ncbi:PHP domain-containing protein [Candidatus Woesearchaeota archaeon]|nr:PHP domain-containing protein [Candidatus Woesearchaeota archaeon]
MRYDLHTHTFYSACSGQRPETLLKAAIRRGMDGIAVTDHDTMEGSAIIERLVKRHNRKEGTGFGLVKGCEFSTDAGDIIGYFIADAAPLRGVRDPFEVIDRIRAMGGLVALPHPFTVVRKGFGLPLELVAERIHALEGLNGRMMESFPNGMARRAAARHSLAVVGGSDGHFPVEVGRAWTLFPGTGPDDLYGAIRKRQTGIGGTTLFGWIGAPASPFYQLGKRMGIWKAP